MLFRRYSIGLIACAAIVSCQQKTEDKRSRSPVSNPVAEQNTETKPTPVPGQPTEKVQKPIKKTLTAAELTQLHAESTLMQSASMKSEIERFRGKMWLGQLPVSSKTCFQYITLKDATPELWTITVCDGDNGMEYSVDVGLLQQTISTQPALPMVKNYSVKPLISNCLADNYHDPLSQARFALMGGFGAHLSDQQFYSESVAGISGVRGFVKLNEPDALNQFSSCAELRAAPYSGLSDDDKIHRTACDLLKRETHKLIENDNLMGCFDSNLNLTSLNAKLYN